MPRFVILEHDRPVRHWDLMLETGSILRTWRLTALPCPGETIDAVAVFDHRLVYLEYEGPISGGRGQVVRREAGTFAWELEEMDRIAVRLSGALLRGILRLEQREGEAWRGEFLADA